MDIPQKEPSDPFLSTFQMELPEVLSPTEPWMSGNLPEPSSLETQSIPSKGTIEHKLDATDESEATKSTVIISRPEAIEQECEAGKSYQSCREGLAPGNAEHKSMDSQSVGPPETRPSSAQSPPKSGVAKGTGHPPRIVHAISRVETPKASMLSYLEVVQGSSEKKSSVQTDRDLGTKSWSPARPPPNRPAAEPQQRCPAPETTPLSKPSEVKVSQERRRKKPRKENRNAALPKYMSKGPKAGLVVAPREAGSPKQERSPLVSMDLAMSHQMENQLNGDFYHLLGFSSPKEEVRQAQQSVEERERDAAVLKEAVDELACLKKEQEAEREELAAARRREGALKDECARGAQALRKQIEEVALLRSDQAVFEQALADADDRAAESEERAEKAEAAVRQLEEQLAETARRAAEAQQGVEGVEARLREAKEQLVQREQELKGLETKLREEGEKEQGSEGLEAKLRAAEEENERLAGCVEEWAQKENEERTKESVEANRKLGELVARVEVVTSEKEETVKRVGELQSLVAELEAEKQATKARLEEGSAVIEERDSMIANLREKLASAEETDVALRTRVEEITAKLADSERQTGVLEAQVVVTVQLLEEERAAKFSLQTILDAAQGELAALSEQVRETAANSEEMRGGLEGAVAAAEEAEETRRQLAEEKERLAGKVERLREEVVAVREEKDTMVEQVEALKKEMDVVAGQKESLAKGAEEMRGQLAGIVEEREALRNEVERLTEELNEERKRTAKKVERLNEQLSQAKESARSECERVKEELAAEIGEKGEAVEEVERLRKAIAEDSKKRSMEVQTLEKEVQVERIKCKEMEERFGELQKELTAVTAELEQCAGRIKPLEKELGEGGAEVLKLQQEALAQRDRCGEIEELLKKVEADWAAEKSNTAVQIEGLGRALTDVSQQHLEANAEVQRLEEELRCERVKVEKAEAGVKKLTEEMTAAGTETRALESNAARLEKTLEEVGRQMTEAVREKERFEEEVRSERMKGEEMKTELHRLEGEVGELRASLEDEGTKAFENFERLESKLRAVDGRRESAIARCRQLAAESREKDAQLVASKQQLDQERESGREFLRGHQEEVVRLERMARAALCEQFVAGLAGTAVEEKVEGLEGQLAAQLVEVRMADGKVQELDRLLAVQAEAAKTLEGKVVHLEGQLSGQILLAHAAEEKAQTIEAQLAEQVKAAMMSEVQVRTLEEQLSSRIQAARAAEEKAQILEGQLARQVIVAAEKAQGLEEQLAVALEKQMGASQQADALYKTAHFAIKEQFLAGLATSAAVQSVQELEGRLAVEQKERVGLQNRLAKSQAAEKEWERRVQGAEERAQELAERMGGLEREVAEGKRLVWSAAGQLRANQERVRSLESKIERLEKQVSHVTQLLWSGAGQLGACHERARVWKSDIERLEKELEKVVQEKREAECLFTSQLEGERAAAKRAAEALQSRVGELEDYLCKNEKKLGEVGKNLKEGRSTGRALEDQFGEERERAEREVDSLCAQLKALEKTVAEKEDALGTVRGELEKVRAAFEAAVEGSKKALAEEGVRHKEEVARLLKHAEDEEGRAAKSLAEKEELEREVVACRGEVERWATEADRLGAERQLLEERLRTETDELRKTEADLRAQLAAAQKDVISAQTALASASEKHVADVETLRAELEAARDGVVSAQMALASASEGHVAEVDRMRAQLAVEQELTEQKGAEWQRQLQQAQMENAEALGDTALALMAAQSAPAEELVTLREEVKAAQAEAAAATALADEQRMECSLAVGDKLALLDQLRSAMDLARKLDARHNELVAATDLEARVAAAQLDTCQKQLQDGQKREQALQQQVAGLDTELAVRGNALAVTEKERQLIQDRCDTAEEQLVVCRAELVTATTALAASTTAIADLQLQLHNLQVCHSELEARIMEERRIANQGVEARGQAVAAAEAQAESLREALGKLSQQRLAVTETNAALQAELNEARAQSDETRGDLKKARAHVVTSEQALLVAHVVSLGLARATVSNAVEAVKATWVGREAAIMEKHRRERELWEETTRRGEAESAELREFSEVEAAVVTERSAELEAAASQLHQQVEALAARLKDAYTQRDDVIKELANARNEYETVQLAFSGAELSAHMKLAGVMRAFKDDMASVTSSHDATIAALQCEVEQLSELQLSTAATALAREQEREEVEKQLATAERQLAALKGDLNDTTDKERELAAEVAACRDEMDRLRQNIAAETSTSEELTQAVCEKNDQIVVLQDQIAELTETTGQLRRQVADKETAAAEAQAEKQAVEGELATCQQELDCLKGALNDTLQSLEESSQKLEAAEQGLEALRLEVAEMTAAKELIEKESAELERQLAAGKAQWDVREKELTEDLRVAEQRANLAEQEKESVTQQVEDLKSMEETLKSALERKRKEEAKLGSVRERINDLEAALGLMKEKLREAEGDNRALKQVREVAAVEIATLTRERDAARAALQEKEAQVREHEKKAAALVEDVMKLELDNDRLEDEVTSKSKDLVQRNREMMAVASKMQKSFLEDKKRLAEDCNKRLAQKNEELRLAQSALESATTAKEDCERKIAILIDNLRKAEREVERLGDECDGMNDLLVTVDEAFDYHLATLTKLKGMRALASRIKTELQQTPAPC